MVAFRKLFPVLAIVALLLGTATLASAQVATGTPLRCTANAGVPPLLRAEGYTELTGDLVVECSGGDPTRPFLANFQLFLNTNITSRIVPGDMVEALLMIDEPGLPRVLNTGAAGLSTPWCVSPGPSNNSASGVTCNPAVAGATYQQGTYNVFRATRGNQSGAVQESLVVWQGIPVTPPGSNASRVFRITNVRANAAGLGASQTLIPTAVIAYISVSPQNTLPIDNPQQSVGNVLTGLRFDVRTCSGGSLDTPVGQNQCQSQNSDWYGDPLRDSAFGAQFGLRYREGFQTAFKPRILPGQDQSLPGQVFNSESGFVRSGAPATEVVTGRPDTSASLGIVGIADSGTRVAARFVNVPANVRIFVSTTSVQTTGGQANAVLVTTDPAGASNFAALSGAASSIIPIYGPTRLSCSGVDYRAIEVPITNGAGVAVWEIQSSNPSAIDELVFPAGWAYRANVQAGQPALGTAQVIGNFAPFYGSGAAERMSAGLVIPRFVARTDANNVFRINQCVTNLLFPYVTNWAGFDTGIAIANTSQDPFSSPADRLQSGKCTINYYGKLANGNPPTTTREETDREIGAGETLTFILSGGGTYGLKGNPNFQGYIIAQCGFLYGHGFAFITDGPIGQARVAEGYLALVLDGADAGRLRGSSLGEVRGH